MRAMVQLPSYVERVASGGRDLPLVLLPLLNDLRAVRGSALLSEGTLLLLNLRSDEPAAAGVGVRGRPRNRGSRAAPAAALPARAARLDPRRAASSTSSSSSPRSPTSSRVAPRRSRCSSSGGSSAPCSRRCARAACSSQRVGQAPARPRRPRAAAPAGTGRAALRGRAAGRTAEQSAVLRRPRDDRRPARRRRAPVVPARRHARRSTTGETRRARRCPHRASS